MFVAELFEAPASQLKQLVIMPGGFHPFHTGHMSLYNSAVKAFPGADVYVAATNDTSSRPFSIEVKKELASIAGLPDGHFVQVKSPFQAREITQHYDPATTALIFVRSEKDRDEPPQAGTVKKDGNPSYLQPIGRHLKPMSQHGYMAYLPTVEFRAGDSDVSSASEIRALWPKSDDYTKQHIAKNLYPKNPAEAVDILNTVLGGNTEPGVAEASPVPDVMMHLIQKYRDDIDYYRELIADPTISAEVKPHYKKKIAALQQKMLSVPKR